MVGVGVGVPGLVRQPDGLVRFAPNLGWVDVPLGDHLAEALGVATPDRGRQRLRPRCHRRAAARQRRRRGQRRSTCPARSASAAASSSTAGCIMGAQGYGGEVGHMRVNPKGRACRCGAIGCWETEIGEPAVRLSAGASPTTSVTDIVARGRSRRQGRQEGSAHRRVDWLGVGVANLVNIFNPDVVVFGGTLREILPATRAEVEAGARGLAHRARGARPAGPARPRATTPRCSAPRSRRSSRSSTTPWA